MDGFCTGCIWPMLGFGQPCPSYQLCVRGCRFMDKNWGPRTSWLWVKFLQQDWLYWETPQTSTQRIRLSGSKISSTLSDHHKLTEKHITRSYPLDILTDNFILTFAIIPCSIWLLTVGLIKSGGLKQLSPRPRTCQSCQNYFGWASFYKPKCLLNQKWLAFHGI